MKLKKDGTISRQGEGSTGRRPLKWKSPEELEQYIQEYYEWAQKNNFRVSVTGLAWWLGCSRTTLINYEKYDENEWLKRCSDEERKGFMNTIKEAKRFIEMNYENSLFNKSSVTGAIFTLKNNYGWVDRQEVVNKEDNDINITLEDE